MALNPQLRVLTLEEKHNGEATIYRLEKGWTLHFVLGPSLAEKSVRLFVNHPADSKSGPNRTVYREIEWQNLSASMSDVYDNFAEVHMLVAGSFNYFFTIDGSAFQANANGLGFFLVDPVLTVGAYDERLPLDCISCQSVLTKNLGLFDQWQGRLQVAKECGYNMIHFTPLQELGKSNSAYSLKDQGKLNPVFSTPDKTYDFDDVERLVQLMHRDWDMLSLTDLVFNHTANESPWIQEHPECVYNVINSPHLKPAYLLDRIIWHFSLEIGAGKWNHRGIPPSIATEEHLNSMRHVFQNDVLPKHKIHEYYLLHIDNMVQDFRLAILDGQKGHPKPGKKVEILPHPQYKRLRATVDMALALHTYNIPRGQISEGERVDQCCHEFRQHIQGLNDGKYAEIQSHLEAAVGNLVANTRWRFVDPNGEKRGVVREKQPIMWNYFVLSKGTVSVDQEEAAMHTEKGAFCMAHNGWVMGDDPLRNFAEPGSNVYLRRELIPWGDSVKLRYGGGPSECPYLWQHMKEYVCQTARLFHGVRLDNCHSTPIHVAEYMLDEARKVRPDLYVIAELFTSSEYTDNIFINRLGLNSLIRESLSAGDAHDEGRLVHRFGGHPVGAFIQPPARPLVPTVAHAIFFDQTHDNPSPVERRCALDVLPNAGLVSMACCASGSNRGYDEIVPHHINVVTEERLYQSWTENVKPNPGLVNEKSGILAAKKALNNLHFMLGQSGYNQVYVDQVDKDIISVTRHNPVSHQSVILVARTAFHEPGSLETGYVPPLCIPGHIDEIILEAKLSPKPGALPFKQDKTYINGLLGYSLQLSEHIQVSQSSMVQYKDDGGAKDDQLQELDFISFPPGSVIAFKVSVNTHTKTRILRLRQVLSLFGYRVHTFSARRLSEISNTELETTVTALSLADINRVLYRCDAEERDDGHGSGAYDVPNYGKMPYCGLQGVMCILSKIRAGNDLGHPLCENLRNGDWLLHYIADRLKHHPGTKKLGDWFSKVFKPLCEIPRYLIPSYFDAIVTGVFMLVEEVAWARMAPFVSDGATFVRALAMGSVQFCSFVPTALLPPLSPNVKEPLPPTVPDKSDQQACLTLAAGLPHFASGIFRNWGRDTFIALRGLLLLTGRFREARYILLGFAGSLRHGLVPNLLGSGTHARYNCRDAVWWWLQCVQEYCAAEGSYAVLQDTVHRLYPNDDTTDIPTPGNSDQRLCDVMQEALQKHADGIAYRERGAGQQIDNDMSDKGFNVSFGVDWSTGFVNGGNEYNCGTWMDKMGSSEKAGNKGKPATPRDGSAIELIGLCKSTVRWLQTAHSEGLYPYEGVTTTGTDKQTSMMSWALWNELIEINFERCFWLSTSPNPACEPWPGLINRRGIYKDCHGASQKWTDFQLRPNQAITMVLAPELFTPKNAWTALAMIETHLMGPLGMKTLDPSDWTYNGDYVNSNDSSEMNLAKGFNYHQGPEWLWPVGYFLRAKLHYARLLEESVPGTTQATITYIKSVLSRHRVHIMSSDWRSLPELTNKNGKVCPDSCEAQAWSVGCLLEVLYDMEKYALSQQA